VFDKSANIDIVFRNGLKNLEILPPTDVWENIQPAISRKKTSIILVRAAAFAIILLSVGLVAYWLTTNISNSFPGTAISLNQDIRPEGTYIAEARVIPDKIKEIRNTSPVIKETIVNQENTPDNPDSKMLPDSKLNISEFSDNVLLKSNLNSSLSGNLIKFSNTGRELNPDELYGKYTFVKAENPNDKWSVSAMGSPTYFSGSFMNASAALSNLKASEQSMVSYSGGLSVSYNLSKRFSIQSGVYYSSVGQKISGISSSAGFSRFNNTKGRSFGIETSVGTIVSTNNDIYYNDAISDRIQTPYTSDVFDPVKSGLQYLNNSIFQNFDYLEVPVIVRYKFIDQKIDFNLTGGLSYNLLVNNSVYTSLNSTSVGKTDGINKLTLSSSLGVGMEYNLSDKLSVNLEPTFRYYISPFGVALGSKIHPYSIGLFSGISYKF
jgi:opacity protein-like surface antigen